jgi:hypothetical protein
MSLFARALAATAGLALLSPSVVRADEVNVSPGNLNGWVTQQSGTASVSFMNGPESPPCGTGSVRLAVGADGNSAAQVRTNIYNGVLLADIETLAYSTFVEQDGSGGQAPYIILNVDFDGNGTTDDQLFFEPVYQNGLYSGDPVPDQGDVEVGEWQTWNARVGGWWSLNAFTFGPPLVTLDNYIAAHPGARLTAPVSGSGSLRVVAGFGAGAWDNFIGNADCVTVGIDGGDVTTYDFEFDSDDDGVPDDEDDCVPSDLRDKVDTGSGPTSIDNVVDENGCSIQDHVNHCAAHAQNHGHYVSCISELANRLKKEGVITNQQAAEMKQGAAQSNVGK